jgi:GT2 family glycosyltransferase
VQGIQNVNLSEDIRKKPLFSWLLSAVLGELNWFRKIRNRISRNANIQDYPTWIQQVEGRYPETDSDTNQALFEAEYKFLLLLHLEELYLESFTAQIRSLHLQRSGNWELHVFLKDMALEELSSIRSQIDLPNAQLHIWNLDQMNIDGEALTQKLAQLDYSLCLFLDENVLLHPRALTELETFFKTNPDAACVYTDLDAITENGERHSPWFKPDWSPELLYSINYLNPLVIRRDALDEIDNFWVDFISGEYWSRLLNYVFVQGAKTYHLPKVMFQIRTRQMKWGYLRRAHDEHEKWLEGHLRESGLCEVVFERDSHASARVRWNTKMPLVSIIIPTVDHLNVLRICVDSLLEKTTYDNYELIIVDTGSSGNAVHEYYDEIRRIGRVSILHFEEEFNYSKVNNYGALESYGDHLLFLNNDVEIVDPDWLEELVRWVELPEIGVVGAKLLFPDRSIQHAGVVLGLGGHAGHIFLGADEYEIGPFGSTGWYRNYLAVTGACMMVDREVFNRIGGFDEQYQLIFSDVDLCIKVVEIGKRVVYSPFARLIHRAGSTRSRYSPREDLSRAFESFLTYLQHGDPYYNRSLSYSDPFPKLDLGGEMSRVERVRKILG